MNRLKIAQFSNWDHTYKDDIYRRLYKINDMYVGSDNYCEEVALAIIKEFSMLEIIFLYKGDLRDFRTED